MPIRPRVREGMDLFGAAPVELATSPCLLLPGEGMGRSPTSTTSQNATGRSPLEVANLLPWIASPRKLLISARRP
jgi:hypothetical protein